MNEKVIVITLNYNQNDYTVKCINSLLVSTHSNLRILLIDNGSTQKNYLQLERDLNQDSRILLKRVVQNIGYVGGINYGLKEGLKLNPDYFMIMNNDTIVDKDAVYELVATCKANENNAIISGKVFDYNEPNKLQLIGIKIIDQKLLLTKFVGKDEIDFNQYDKIEEFDLLDDVFWLFPAELYQKIGGYSPYFWFNYEQEDFAIRAKNSGYKLIYTPKAKIWHKGSISIGGRGYNPNGAYWWIQSELILKYLHLKKIHFANFYLKTVYGIIRTFIKSIYFKFSGKQNILNYAKAKYFGWMYFNKWLITKNVNSGYNPLVKKKKI